MSLKLFLFLAPVAVGGYFVANGRQASAPAGNGTATAEVKAAPHKSREECNALEQRLLLANAPTDDNPLRAIAAVTGVERELRQQGCDTMNGYGGGDAFQAPSNRMGNAPPPSAMGSARRRDGTSFEPGRPMVDVSRHGAR